MSGKRGGTDCAQEIDGLREAELAGKQIGTTKRGIGPAYASKATRNGVRVGELRDLESFATKLRVLARDGQKRFEHFEYDVEVGPRPRWTGHMCLRGEPAARHFWRDGCLVLHGVCCNHIF
jgi:hypothetical protein